jgi:hypothetical protein
MQEPSREISDQGLRAPSAATHADVTLKCRYADCDAHEIGTNARGQGYARGASTLAHLVHASCGSCELRAFSRRASRLMLPQFSDVAGEQLAECLLAVVAQ